MPGQDLVRPSRDGDQFHYHWAARWCLQLLSSTTDLVAVTIEGPSRTEPHNKSVDIGDEVIDVGLYFGTERREDARLIRYIQLKYSTRSAHDPWTTSGLKKTVTGFAKRHKELCALFPIDDVAKRFAFEFTTNRPIKSDVREALADLRSGAAPRHPKLQKQLIGYAGLPAGSAAEFFRLLHVAGDETDLWTQRNLLARDTCIYLPEADQDAPVQLKELVTRKATTEFESDPSIRRHDVLRALRTDEDQLHPAPSYIPAPSQYLRREQEREILHALLTSKVPVVIHADGGVGKSVLAARLAMSSMPPGSEAILYDCFGDGLYRNAMHFRHRHRDALVQIANEIAARGLCDPLIQSARADAKHYMRAFVARLAQAARLLRGRDPEAQLCLIIDAADNAEMAAEEQNEAGSFVRDLIRAPLPNGVHLAFTCRTHRRSRLHAPPEVQEIELRPFSHSESREHLRTRYPEATDGEVAEFAVLSGSNPRVQSLALAREMPLHEVLQRLGPNPTTIERAIGDMLEAAISRLRDRAAPSEQPQIDLICQGLALLRPLVPLAVLAQLAGTSEAAVRDFILDFGRPLLLKGNSLHFVDEPAETWFRERFSPSNAALTAFLDRLRPLTAQSSYAAATLPQLLLRANRIDELVELALSGRHLPSANPLEKRDVELQRLTFALKACLEHGKHVAAAKLALKVGGECAGEERQNHLIQENTDLAAALMAPDRIEEIVSRHTFRSGWMGSHHAYDAGLLAGRAELQAEASSRLRMALDWLNSWARRSKDAPEHERVSTEDIAELAIAILRLRGASAAAGFLRTWTPRRVAFEAGRQAAQRLASLGRYDQINALAEAATTNTWLLLGVAVEARAVGSALTTTSLTRLLRLLCDSRLKLPESKDWESRWDVMDAVRSVVELGLLALPHEPEAWADLLRRYLPSEPPAELAFRFGRDRAPLLRSYALEAALRGRALSLNDVTPPTLRDQLDKGRRSEETDVFKSKVGGLLDWFVLSAEVICGRTPPNLEDVAAAALRETSAAVAQSYRADAGELWQAAARAWFQTVRDATRLDPSRATTAREAFESWLAQRNEVLSLDTLVTLCHFAAQTDGFDELALRLAGGAFAVLDASREHAESRADWYATLARAVLVVSPAEARHYFDRAVEIASRIGEENLERWTALLHLATAAGERDNMRSRSAYRLSRVAELTYEYVARDKHFDWDGTMEAIADLCGPSALTILSRWRDRDFGYQGRTLPVVIDRLITRGQLPALATIVLAGLEARWDRVAELKRAVENEPDFVGRSRIAEIAYRYIRVGPATRETWSQLNDIGSDHGFDFPDLKRLLARERGRDAGEEFSASPVRSATGAERRSPDWDAIFEGVDLTDADALRVAYGTLRTFDPPFEFQTFFREAFRRVLAGRRPELVRALATWPEFGVFEARYLVEALPFPLPRQMALRTAVRDALLIACRRQPEHVHRRGWPSLPFARLYAEGIVSDADVVGATLAGFANRVASLNASQFFQIVDPLATYLSAEEADNALNFGLDLLEDVLRPEDGDGSWRPALQPPPSVMVALAGYVWAGLGSPRVAERWQHAHVVRSIVELEWTELLEALVERAETGTAGPFVDQGLAFYLWHARQWLLLGLVRGGFDSPAGLRAATSFLQASLREEHVLVRELAAQGLRALRDAGVPIGAPVGSLDLINRSDLIDQPYSGDRSPVHDEAPDVEEAQSDDEKYYFGLDIGPYWFQPLGRVFGVTQCAIERRAHRAIRQCMRWTGGHAISEDARHQRKIFADGETYHSHGSFPKADDLRAYHGYHGMMFAAAALLREVPARRASDESRDEFRAWMSHYLPTRADGGWRFDRRDPRMVADPHPPNGYRDQAWCCSVTAECLDDKLVTDDGMLVLWGDWSGAENGYEEAVSVRSAFASRNGSEALIAALQTAANLHRFALPRAGMEDDLEVGPLRLRGWILDEDVSARLDAGDPWAQGLRYPGPEPCDDVMRAAGLMRSADGRTWRDSAGGMLRSELWTRVHGYGRQEEIVSGERLSANVALLERLMDLYVDESVVLSVEISRRLTTDLRDSGSVGDYSQPYTRYYLMGVDGVAHPLKSRS